MTYDEALQKTETIVSELERAEAMPMSEYRKKADEAKRLLDFCEKELGADPSPALPSKGLEIRD